MSSGYMAITTRTRPFSAVILHDRGIGGRGGAAAPQTTGTAVTDFSSMPRNASHVSMQNYDMISYSTVLAG